jgi:glycosyltransferase involved in cell wall biosynthesis
MPAVSFKQMSSESTVSPLRILHYVPGINLEQGGVVRAVLDWCSVMAERGHQMTLVVYTGKDIPADWLNHMPGKPRAIVIAVPIPPAKQLQRRSMRLVDKLLQQTDVLHLHGPWLDGNRQIANLARRRHVPYVVSLHGMLDDWAMRKGGWKKRLYMNLFGRRTLDNAARIHCTADAELAQGRKWFDNPATIVLPYLVDLKPYENLPGPDLGLARLAPEDRQKPRLLFLSRLDEQKGVDILLRMAGAMRDNGVDFILLIAGTGLPEYENSIRSLATELNLDDRIRFLGQVNGTEKLSLYQSADLFVLPTRHENFGLVLIEAMACGTPVLTTRGTDIWTEVQSAGGEVVESTPHALALAAGRLLNDPADRLGRGASGRSWVFLHLAVERLGPEFERLYREIRVGGAPG